MGPGASPFEVLPQWDWDPITLAAGTIGSACSLYDSDCDGNANLAVCVTIRGGATPPTVGAVRLFTCDDLRPDRCGAALNIPGNRCVGGTAPPNTACNSAAMCPGGGACLPGAGKNTTCSVAIQNTDPFPAGEASPQDAVATCSVDVDDFDGALVNYESATLVDACSYSSELGHIAAPSDCVLFKPCTLDAECDDGNPATSDTCDLTVTTTLGGACKHFTAGSACGDGQFCTVGDSCASVGVCAGGGPRDCSDPNACTVDVCNEATDTCVHDAAAANGFACGSPGDTDCDNPDTCSAGACLGNNEPAGFICTTDGNECTDDVCNGSGACTHPNDDTNTCGSNSDTDCDNADTCSAGACLSNNEPAGLTCTTDGNECTDDVCNGSGACTHPNDDTNTCGSSSDTECADPGTCSAGACLSNNEPPGTPCGSPGDTDCDDPDTCNGSGTCQPNTALPGTACGDQGDTDCTDPDACDDTGVCQPNNAANGTACNDGQFCTTTDQCSLGSCVGSGNPCTDTNACTPDKCDEAQNACVFNQVCDDDDDGEDDDDDGEHDEEDYDHNGDDNDGEDDDECDDDDDEHSGSCILKTTGGGRTYEGSEFGFNAKGVIGSWDKGEFNYRGGNVKIHGKVTQILDAYETPDGGVMKFEVTSKDGSTKYHVTVEDHGEPGKNKDALKIYKVSGPGPAPNTTARQIVKSGNIQWHSSLDQDDED